MKEEKIDHNENQIGVRLNKFISETGICSRRKADEWIQNRKVTINGQIAEMGTRVSPEDEIRLNGKLLQNRPKLVYIALNKPKGIICTTEQQVHGNIINFVNYPQRIFPIGRLDKDSDGLIFLTNDGDIVNKILRAGNHHEKEYIVTVDKPITKEFILGMSKGVKILGTTTKSCFIKKESICVFRIILTQGLNRQIRRMCEVFGYQVLRLQRIRIMNVTLDRLPIGKWRHLTIDELKSINKLIASSIKTEEASK